MKCFEALPTQYEVDRGFANNRRRHGSSGSRDNHDRQHPFESSAFFGARVVPYTSGMDTNPYQAGTPFGDESDVHPDLVNGQAPSWQRALRFLGVAKILEASLEMILVLGSALFMMLIGSPAFRRVLANPLSHAYLLERFLALPALVGISIWIGRGLIGFRRPAIFAQSILSLLIAFCTLLWSFTDLTILEFHLAMLSASPVVASMNIVFYLTKVCSGIGHAVIAVFLFRVQDRVPESSAELVASSSNGESGRVSYILVSAVAILLAIGTIAATHWLALVVVKQLYLHVPGR